MRSRAARAGQQRRLELASVRTGQDWARWLDQAMPAQPFRTQWPASRKLAVAWAALAQLARYEGFCAERCGCAGPGAATTWADRRIHPPRHASPGQALTALAHQLGHVLLHGDIAYLNRSGSFACRGIRSAEATSVAYLATAHLGIATTTITVPHPSRWAEPGPRGQPGTTMQAVADRVMSAAATITRHLDAALAAELGPQGQLPSTGTLQAPDIGARSGPAPPGHTSPGGAGRQTGRTRPLLRGCATGPAPAPQAPGAAARPRTPPRPRGQLVAVQHTAARFFRSQLPGSWVPGYLTSRGLGPATQAAWQAGYALPAWDALTRHLRRLGYPDTVIEAAGLARTSRRGTLIDTFRDRAMLPIRDTGGIITGFIGRAPGGAGPQVPKYLNSPATALYRKRAVLFGLWQARRLLAHGARPVITEGPLDAIAVTTAGAGRFAGIAPCGTALTPEQAVTLARSADLATTGVVVAFDPDPAGRNAAIAACHLLIAVTDDLTTARLPAGHDPADLLAERGPAALARALTATAPLADLVIDAETDRWSRWLRYPEGQFSALRAAAPLIAALPPGQVARQVARLAHRLRLDYATVTQAVTGAVADAVSPASAVPHDGRRRRPPI